jgi:hypothetical protein
MEYKIESNMGKILMGVSDFVHLGVPNISLREVKTFCPEYNLNDSLALVMCWLGLKAVGRAKPGREKPGPNTWPGTAFGPA